MPMPDTLAVALSEDWRDCLAEVCLVPLALIVWGEVPDLCQLLPTDIVSRCHIMRIGVAAAPPGKCHSTPGADSWHTEAFWDAVFADHCRGGQAFLFLLWRPDASEVPIFDQVWATAGRALPIGCRRGLVWIPRDPVPQQLPAAVSNADPLLEEQDGYACRIWSTMGILPAAQLGCVWEKSAYRLWGRLATRPHVLLSAIHFLTVQKMPTDWWPITAALPWTKPELPAAVVASWAEPAPPAMLMRRAWICQPWPMPDPIEQELWARPLEQRHMALRPLIGRPLNCRQRGTFRCPCVVLASALRVHYREFPPGAQLPQDRFALDLPSRMEALPWKHVPIQIARPLREVVFQIAMGR